MPRLCHAIGLWMLGLASGLVTPVQAGDNQVELSVPSALRPLLQSNLHVWQASQDPKTSDARFRFLARHAADEARDLLATEGYFSPQVTSSLEPYGTSQRLRLEIDPGQPSTIAAVDLVFHGAFAEAGPHHAPHAEALRRDWRLAVGQVFRDGDWQESKSALLKSLRQQRYPAARITDSLAEVDPERHAVTLRVVVDSGPAFHFGDLVISGLDTLPERIVSGLNPIKPGKPYLEADLQEFQNRLQRTGYFSSVFVSLDPDVEQAAHAPIRVQVVEDTARKIGLGVGYSTDTGAGLELRYADSLTFRPGWRSTSHLNLDQREQSITGELKLVPIDLGFQPIVKIEAKHSDIQGDENVTTRLIGQLRRADLHSDLSLSLDLNFEWDRNDGRTRSDVTSMPLNISWTRRVLDDALFPRRGFVINLQAGGAGHIVSNTPFVRLYARGNLYLPVAAGGTLLLRGELGGVEATTRVDIPTDYLFRAGGSQSVRGYEYGSLGIDSGDSIEPGRYIGVAGIEWMFPILPNWLGAVFVDAGNVVDRIEDYEARLGYGLGIRWKSPLGPLNLDVAHAEHDDTWRLHFSVGSLF
jgi:translocation and assembly module TamA